MGKGHLQKSTHDNLCWSGNPGHSLEYTSSLNVIHDNGWNGCNSVKLNNVQQAEVIFRKCNSLIPGIAIRMRERTTCEMAT